MAGDAAASAYTLSGLAVPEELTRLHELLEQVSTEHPALPDSDVMLLETAVIEVAGNVVQHGRPVGRVQWVLTVEVHPSTLVARLADSGEEYVETWTGEMPGLMAESGRGMPLAEATTHELTYERADEHNVWTMTRHYSAGGPEATG